MLIDRYRHAGVNFLSTDPYLKDPCDENAAKYISEYYRNRRKESAVFNYSFSNKMQPFCKASHTLSAFLLGLCLKELVEDQVCNLLYVNAPNIKNDFEYPWFLSCLYHDAYSNYERHHEDEATASFSETKLNLEIDHDIYAEQNGILGNNKLPLSYQEETITEYYQQRFRNDEEKYGKGTADHGILSGYYCYDRLVKNYLRHRRIKGNGQSHFTTQNENGKELKWDEQQIWVFGLAADAIIAHNIWHTNRFSSIPQVCPNGTYERKLSIERTPLAYFLSLIDTIEPIKWFAAKQKNGEIHSEWDILKHIDIEMRDNKIFITQDHNIFGFEEWFNGKEMENMNSWLHGINILEHNDRKIIIKLPH